MPHFMRNIVYKAYSYKVFNIELGI